MAITVTPLLTLIHDCDTASWSGGSLDTGVFKQGTGALGASVSNTTSSVYYYTLSPAVNFTGYHLYQWMLNTTRLDTKANGGLRMYMYSSNGASKTWYVAGSDTYPGGWQCYVVDPSSAANVTSGTFDITQVTRVGVQFKTLQRIKAGLITSYWDAVRYGSGLRITSASTDTITFEDIYGIDDDTTNAYGIISKSNGVYYLQGELVFGSTTAGQHISFSDNNQIVVFKDQPVNTSLYKIQLEGNSTGTINFQLGSSSGTGSSTLGLEGVTFKTANSSLPYQLNFASTYIDQLNLYGSNFISPSQVYLGSTTTALGGSGSTVNLVDTTFNTPTQVIKNISSSATTLLLRSKVTFATDTNASLDMYDAQSLDSEELQIIGSSTDGGPGFEATSTGTQTLEVSNHNFNQMDKPYLTVAADETWNVINPSWTVTDQTEIDFTSSTSNIVNEKYSLDLTIQTPSGDKLQNAYTYVYEGTVNQNLPTANHQATDAGGLASSEILKKTYTDGGGTALTTTTYGDFALKVYYYGRSPFVGTLTATAAIDQSVTLVTDAAIAEATQATAVTNGSGITLDYDATDPHSLIEYSGGTNTLNVGETITGTGGATGVVVEIVEGDSSAGKVFLDTRNSTAFANGDSLSSSGTWTGTYVSDSELRYSWQVDCNNLTLQVTYDYLAAKMAAGSPDAIFIDAIEWGEDEQSQLLYSGASGYYTERNINLTAGVFLVNSGGGTIAYFTADDGSTYTPPSTITLTLRGVTQNTQCYIVPTAGGSALLNSSATTNISGNEYSTSASYVYTTDVPVTIRAREMGYLPYEASGTITNADFTITAVWQVDPNWQLVVTGESITFNDADPDTIVRATGDFAAEGWIATMSQVTVTGSTSNDGTYEIANISTNTITLAGGETLTAGTDPTGVTLTFTRREPNW